jgi:hypothetical protein
MIRHSNYGKSKVRLVKVEREAEVHQFRELTVHIQFEGDYDECYETGDNSRILPTDTMKNTVYALARKAPLVRSRISENGSASTSWSTTNIFARCVWKSKRPIGRGWVNTPSKKGWR